MWPQEEGVQSICAATEEAAKDFTKTSATSSRILHNIVRTTTLNTHLGHQVSIVILTIPYTGDAQANDLC
jgi:hypothetical protein